MNRQLLFLGISLGLIAILVTVLFTFLSERFYTEPANGIIFLFGLQINIFHALMLLIMSWLKRKYTDAEIISAGQIFTVGTLLFSGAAYFNMLTEDSLAIFNMVGLAGAIVLLAGWIALFRALYITFIKKHNS
jgi:uncharacterized membrane protein YgdD (TMEM256/DUF423 family)